MDDVLQYLYNNLFQCKMCGGRFSSKAHLTEHEQKVHDEALSKLQDSKREDKNQDREINTLNSSEKIIEVKHKDNVHNESTAQCCNSNFSFKDSHTQIEQEHTVGREGFSNLRNVQTDGKFWARGKNTPTDHEEIISDCVAKTSDNEYFKSKYEQQAHSDVCFEWQDEKEENKNRGEKLKTLTDMKSVITGTIADNDDSNFSQKCLHNNMFQCKVCNARFPGKAHLKEHEDKVHSDIFSRTADKTEKEEMSIHNVRARTTSNKQVHVPYVESSYNGYNFMHGSDNMGIGYNLLDGNDNEILRQRMEQFNAYLRLVRDKMNEMTDSVQETIAEGMNDNRNSMTVNLSRQYHDDIVTDKFPETYKVKVQTSETTGISGTQNTEGGHIKEMVGMKDSLSKNTLEKKFKCDRCGSAFAHNHKLIRHYRIHTGEKPYKCEICGAAFSQKSILNNHVTVHTGEKPFKCETCNASFSLKGYLIKHQRTHTGEKPFKCDMCDSVFSDRGNLSKHRKIHFGEKPYKCSICGAAFSDRSTLTKHSRIHTDGKKYKCEFCNASFSMKSALTTHKKMHTDDVQHKCDICDAEFSQRGYLIRHLRTHTGEKQYIPSLLLDKKNDEIFMNEEQ